MTMQMNRGWQPAPPGYVPTGAYKGLQFPLRKLDDVWMVVDESHGENGVSVKLFDNRDDPDHEFLKPEAWHLWPNKRKLSEWYNAPHTKTMRLRQERMMEFTIQDMEAIDKEWDAKFALELQALIMANPDDEHIVGGLGTLEWSPTGQVWRRGEKWVVIPPPGAKQ